MILPAVSGETIRKKKCGSLETFLSSCLSSSMHRAACALAAKSCQLLSSVCKRKSCLRAQIFVLKESGPNLKPFLHANSSWIARLTQVSFLKVLSEPQLPQPPCVPRTVPLTTTLQKARSLLSILPPCLLPGDPTLVLARPANHGKQSQVRGATSVFSLDLAPVAEHS